MATLLGDNMEADQTSQGPAWHRARVGGRPRDMAMRVQQHQGLHGEGYVSAMASSAGLPASRPIVDVDRVDWPMRWRWRRKR
jgi:hypothetical protein